MNDSYNKKLKPFARQLRNSGTKAEACLWKYVLRAGKMKGYNFKRQRPVLNYIADFICEDLKLVIEVDGITHHDDAAIQKDKNRDEAFSATGYTVLRFADNQVLNEIANVSARIERWIEENVK